MERTAMSHLAGSEDQGWHGRVAGALRRAVCKGLTPIGEAPQLDLLHLVRALVVRAGAAAEDPRCARVWSARSCAGGGLVTRSRRLAHAPPLAAFLARSLLSSWMSSDVVDLGFLHG